MNRLFYSLLFAFSVCISQTGNSIALSSAAKWADRTIGFIFSGKHLYNTYLSYQQSVIFEENLQSSIAQNSTNICNPLDPMKPNVEQIRNIINKLCGQIGLDASKIYLFFTSYFDYAAAFDTQLQQQIMIIGKDFINLPLSQQRSILTHELMHLKNNDSMNRVLFLFTSPFAIAGICHISAFGIEKIFPWIKKQAIKFDLNHCATLINKSQKFATTILRSAIFQYCITRLLQPAYSRFQEKRADIQASQLTGCAEDLIDFLEDVDLKQAFVGNHQTGYKRLIASLFAHHPSIEQRIAYLQPYIQ